MSHSNSNSNSNTTKTTKEMKMNDLKELVVRGEFIRMRGAHGGMDLRHFGIHLLAKVIPEMYERGEYAFSWIFRMKELCAMTKQEYDDEVKKYVGDKMKKDNGDATWFYDFKGVRCVMTTEIWYYKNKDMPTSPVALLFGQLFGEGIHITKCRFEKKE